MFLRKSYFFVCLCFFSTILFGQENKVIQLEIAGNKKIKTSYLRKVITTKKGVVLDSVSIQQDVLFLKRLPAVRHAYFTVHKIDKNAYKVKIGIQENFTILPEVNFWTTTNKQFAYKIGFYDYNFLGENITFGGFYQRNAFNSYGINFKATNLFSKHWGLAVNHQNWKSEEPLYFGDQTANYLYNNVSFEVLGLYQINLKNTFNFGINIFSEKYQYLSGDTAANVPPFLELDKMLLKAVYSYYNLDYFYQYVSGVKNDLYLQYVITENDFQNDFLIAWNDFFYYKRVGAKGNWANRIRFGLSSNEDSPFAPFALDNNVNLRGVGILVDRGTGSFVVNTEYRHTVYDKKWLAIQTNLFTDFGTWRNPGGELNDFIKSENLKMYSGVGVRFISEKIYNATFRIDYGFSVLNTKNNSKGGFVFGIGQYF